VSLRERFMADGDAALRQIRHKASSNKKTSKTLRHLATVINFQRLSARGRAHLVRQRELGGNSTTGFSGKIP